MLFFQYWFFSHPQPHTKIKFHFNALKESNTIFQVQAFDHKAFFEHWFALVWPFTRQGPGMGYYQCSLVYTGQGPGMGCYRCSACAQLLTLHRSSLTLVTCFFRQALELKIQRKNPSSASQFSWNAPTNQ